MLKYLLPLSVFALAWSQPALAQRGRPCVSRSYAYSALLLTHRYHHHSSCADTVDRPFEPSRWGFFFGLAGAQTRHGIFGGGEFEGTYRVASNVQAGLVATALVPQRIASNLGVSSAEKPMLGLYAVSTRAHLFLLDNAKLRLGLLAGTGAGVATLADRAQQVVDKGQDTSCGCTPSTHARTVATSVGLVGLGGASLTYKLRPDLWLTGNAYYQQWAGATQFGRQADLSPWIISLGLTMPDRRK